MNFKKKLVASILCAATAMGVSESANATAYATAILDLSNVKLVNNSGGDVTLNDFSFISANNSGAATASLNGAFPVASTSDTQSIFAASGGAINLTNQYQGVNAVGDDNYAIIPPVPGTSAYTNADADLAGSIIDLGSGAGASAETRTDSWLPSLGTGNSQSNLALSSSAEFTIASTLASGFFINFDYLVYVASQLTPDETVPGAVGANTSWSMRLYKISGTGAAYDQTFTNSILNQITAVDAPANGTDFGTSGSTGATGSLSFATGVLDINNRYRLVIQHDTNTYATSSVSVPEPTSLILLGLGLVGIAWSAKRKTADLLAA